jgi:transposase
LSAGAQNQALNDNTLGREFAGVPGCGYFSAYRRYMKESSVCLQFCLAH